MNYIFSFSAGTSCSNPRQAYMGSHFSDILWMVSQVGDLPGSALCCIPWAVQRTLFCWVEGHRGVAVPCRVSIYMYICILCIYIYIYIDTHTHTYTPYLNSWSFLSQYFFESSYAAVFHCLLMAFIFSRNHFELPFEMCYTNQPAFPTAVGTRPGL